MATQDITRSAFYRSKRYADLRMQQGRVLTDDDFNEAGAIRLEDTRLGRLAVIGPWGSADEGFRIGDPVVAGGNVDFSIGAGTLFIGGHRAELAAAETFRLQRDWLTRPETPAPAGGAERVDLVYVTAWLQPVVAVEDSELLEPALGGPDTATRLRLMTRVAVEPDVGGDGCEAAWAVLRERLAEAGMGTVDDHMELVPDTRFTVTFALGGDGNDLCSPEVLGGYLGAENRAIRVQLVEGGRFIWGYDNGAPLYRVRLEDAGGTVRFLTEPKDVGHWPVNGQTVEVIAVGAVLPNGEMLAEELGARHFATVEGGYDSATRTIRLTPGTAVPVAFGTEWSTRADAGDLWRSRFGLADPEAPYYFLRVWDRGADTAPEPTLPLGADPAALGTTGLLVTVEGADRRPGDHCIIAARPATPDRVMPWELMVGRAPHGFRRFVAPLAVLRWSGGAGEVVRDCRPRFRPLTRLRGCCTFTVGDGERSHGDFRTIREAVEALPPEGGQVCVMPGRYRERVELIGRRNVTISGCGPRSVVEAPDETEEPLFRVRAGSAIALESLRLVAPTGPAVDVDGRSVDGRSIELDGLALRDLLVEGRDAQAVRVRFVRDLEMRHCRIRIGPLDRELTTGDAVGRSPAVFLLGDDMLVAECRIEAEGDGAGRRALGGLQIGGGSERVLIRDTLIAGGNGHGIELGHLLQASQQTVDRMVEAYAQALDQTVVYSVGTAIAVNTNGCIVYTPPGGGADDPDEGTRPPVFVTGGDLRDIEIRDNRIEGMGLSGIASPLAFNQGRPVMPTVTGLIVRGNRIQGCAQLELPDIPRRLRLYVAFGGIALLDVEQGVFTANTIAGNGRRHLDPVCGIHLFSAESVSIFDNRILENGPRIETDDQPRAGQRGGIVIAAAAPHAPDALAAFDEKRGLGMAALLAPATSIAVPAAMIAGNMVEQPMGKALTIMGRGAMQLHANHLASQGTPTRSLYEPLVELLEDIRDGEVESLLVLLIDRLLGSAVTVVNFGVTSELADLMLMSQILRGQGGTIRDPGFSVGSQNILARQAVQNGEILFADNVVTQNFIDRQASFTLSAALFVGFDDVSVQDNAFSMQMDLIADRAATNVLALGWSLRVSGNRMEETIRHALLSAATFGLFNATTLNQGTHCFQVQGPAALRIDEGNRSLVQAFDPLACGGCIQPPFDGLQVSVFDPSGAMVSPQVQTFGGQSGLWTNARTEIRLAQPVDRVRVTLLGIDVSGVTIRGQGENGAWGHPMPVPLGQAEPFEATLSMTGMQAIAIETPETRVIALRLCVDGPSLGSIFRGGAGGMTTNDPRRA